MRLPVISAETKRAAAWLAVAVGLVYASSIFGGYHFDDSHSVESNLSIRSLGNIPLFWTDSSTSSMIPENRVYRPLVYTFYALCWKLGGGSTLPFHLMKMVMHWGVALCLFLIWRCLWSEPGWWPLREPLRIQIPLLRDSFTLDIAGGALLLALVFAVHPAGSECVNYIASTTSLQCALFYVMAYWFYLSGREPFQPRHLLLSLFCYFLAVASKEEGITLPAMVLVTELFLLPTPGGLSKRLEKAIRTTLPFGALGLVLAFWLYSMHANSGDESRGLVSSPHYFMTQWRAYLYYMGLWFWPWELNADSASWTFSTRFWDTRVLQAAVGNLALITVAVAKRKRYPALLFGLLWFYITISPASSVVVLAEAVNERRMYLAYIGFVGGTAVLLFHAAEVWFVEPYRALKIGALVSLVMAGLSWGTLERNRVWRTDENLWLDTVEKNPTSGRAHNNLALVYMARRDYERAVHHLELCQKYWTSYTYCVLNHGVVLDALGRLDEAEAKFKDAYRVTPRNIHVQFHYGRFLADRRGKYAEAIPFFEASVQGSGGRYPAADYRAGECYAKLKRWPEAMARVRHGLEAEPDSAFGWFTLGTMQLEAGDFAGSQKSLQEHLRLNPQSVQGWYNLGVLHLKRLDFVGARDAMNRALEYDPKSEQAWYNLTFIAERLSDAALARDAVRRLLSLQPANADYQRRAKELEKRFGT